ncbi:MAG: hypothetical protein N2441_09055 [Rhodocyclaceae bacterium]|nr:hypothetical protein [Rhodocyclaceae bacterium]
MATDPTIKIRIALDGAQNVRAQLQGVTQNADRVADALRRIGHYGAAVFAFSGIERSVSPAHAGIDLSCAEA